MKRCDWCGIEVHDGKIVEVFVNFYSSDESQIKWSDYTHMVELCKACAKNAALLDTRMVHVEAG